jgi:hypothetical protein
MKYIIAILLLILIVFFTMKKSIEYRKEKLEEICDANCGKHTREGSCLSCKNCGVCKLTRRDKIYTYCLSGDKNGSYFNDQCKGLAWTFNNNVAEPTQTQPKITIDTKPRTYVQTSNSISYPDILSSIGQQVDKKSTVSTYGDIIGVPKSNDETLNEKKIGVTTLPSIKQKSYNDIIAELQRLSLYFKK